MSKNNNKIEIYSFKDTEKLLKMYSKKKDQEKYRMKTCQKMLIKVNSKKTIGATCEIF